MFFSSACVEKMKRFSCELSRCCYYCAYPVHDTGLINLCLPHSPIKYDKMDPLMSLVCREFPEMASVLTLK